VYNFKERPTHHKKRVGVAANVCGAPKQTPSHRTSIKCPLNCKMIMIKKSNFELKPNGLTIVDGSPDTKVKKRKFHS
jgi:hypothetical protein